jgi:hypothetical protein
MEFPSKSAQSNRAANAVAFLAVISGKNLLPLRTQYAPKARLNGP